MVASQSVLIVEDDLQVATTLLGALQRDGWHAETVPSFYEGRARLSTGTHAILVVDIGLPDGNGLDFVKEAAGRPDVGIVVVSGRSEELDRILGLELGADDYIIKPFSIREFAARIRALARRMEQRQASRSPAAPQAEAEAAPRWHMGSVTLDPMRLRIVAEDGSETRLTGGEAGLLKLMLEAEDRTVERESIAEKVLGHRLMPHQRGVDQLASALRRKLAAASGERIQIVALRGHGYRLVG